MKKIIVIAVLVAAMAAFLYFIRGNSKEENGDVPETTIVEVSRGTILQSVEATGNVTPNLNVEIKCKASGEIISLPYNVSDEVKKGDLLLELDPEDEERNVSKAKVSLSSTRAGYKKTKRSLEIAEKELELARRKAEASLEAARIKAEDAASKAERVKYLYERKLASKEEYETAITSAVQAETSYTQAQIAMEEIGTQEASLELKRQDLEISESSVESSEISLDIAEQRLDDTRIYAPIDGVITSLDVQTGQIISSGISNVGGGTTVMVISDLSRIFILASVDESDIGKVQPGQRVDITADAFPDERFSGKVERVAQKGVTVSSVVTFEVEIEVLSKNKNLLKPEMSANVEIIVANRENVLVLPTEALVGPAGRKFALLPPENEGEKPQRREVETGASDGVSVEIAGGLEEGEKVLVNNGAASSRWSREGQQDRRRPPMGGPMMRGH